MRWKRLSFRNFSGGDSGRNGSLASALPRHSDVLPHLVSLQAHESVVNFRCTDVSSILRRTIDCATLLSTTSIPLCDLSLPRVRHERSRESCSEPTCKRRSSERYACTIERMRFADCAIRSHSPSILSSSLPAHPEQRSGVSNPSARLRTHSSTWLCNRDVNIDRSGSIITTTRL